jgi:hypothetical protein
MTTGPALDSCIESIFEPGNPGNATDSGAITRPHYSGFLLTEEMTEGVVLDSLGDASPWIFIEIGSHWQTIITGTWSGGIAIDTSYTADDSVMNGVPSIFTNGTYGGGPVAFSFYQRWRMASYSSGFADLNIHVLRDQYILIEEAGASIGRLKLE